MLSNCSSEPAGGGLRSTPMTEKRPSSGSNLDPRLPDTPVTTTTGLGISSVFQPELAMTVARTEVVARLTAHPVFDAGRRFRQLGREVTIWVRDQSMRRWFAP